MARCPVCSADHAACGTATTVVGIDLRVTIVKEGTVGDLKRYTVDVPNRRGTIKATLLLSDEDAKAQGLLKLTEKTPPTNKAAQPPKNKADAPPGVGSSAGSSTK